MNVRRLALVATVCLLATLAPVATPAPAFADFASECASPTRVISTSTAEAITLTSTDVLLFTGGTFTGGMNDLPNGSVICIGPGAVFLPQYLNNASGRMLNAGTATLPAFASGAGASVENSGTLNFPQGVNNNGPTLVTNLAGATITLGTGISLGSGAAINNAGTITVAGGVNFNSGTSLINTGSITISGDVNLNGDLNNQGFLTMAGLTLNGGSRLDNSCVILANQLLVNSAVANNGRIDVGTGNVTLNGSATYSQSLAGYTTGGGYTNNGSVSGFGAYQFAGFTTNNGTFAGGSAASPIVFDDQSRTGAQIFDTQNGTVTNTVPGPITLPGDGVDPAGCAQAPTPATDIVATKTGPAQATPGSTVTYTITLTNVTGVPAANVVLTDGFSANLTNVTTNPAADSVVGGTAQWTVGTLAGNATLTFTVTGTAPASGTVTDVVSATTTTPDTLPANNDGSQSTAQVTTEVVVVLPPNNPPVVGNVVVDTVANIPIGGSVPLSDPDPGQTVTAFLSVVPGQQPANGTVFVDPSGAFVYLPDTDFTGRDTFGVLGCDNGEPIRCDTGTVTVVVRPVALADIASTTQGVPADIDVRLNDVGTTANPTVITQPANGTATVGPTGIVTYTPNPGFTGTDTFSYRICSPTASDVCDTASVVVDVIPPPEPPEVPDATNATTVGGTVTGVLASTSPDGSRVLHSLGTQLIPGTLTVNLDGSYSYTASGPFTGVGTFTEVGCAIGSRLCDIGTVTITVSPIANPDTATTPQDTPVDIAVAANDLGAVGPPQPGTAAHGTVTVLPDGGLRYTPAAGFTGTDQFTYTICSRVTPTVCATTTVTVTVTAAPTPTPTPPPAPGVPVPGEPGTLPVTGAPALVPALGGALLVLLGFAMLWLTGRRKRA